jgi:alpha-L-arabinofuranosidase
MPLQLGADVAITLNYSSNANCTGPDSPSEAAAWVNYANNTQHYGIKYWTVGNEQYYPGYFPGVVPQVVDLPPENSTI